MTKEEIAELKRLAEIENQTDAQKKEMIHLIKLMLKEIK